MCGRYTHLYTWKQLHRLMRLTTSEESLPLRYNVAPTQNAPVVRAEGSGRGLSMLRWGFVPSWSKDGPGGAPLINARAEGIETKPTFRASLARRRCVVPISGFYEWKKVGAGKVPHYITSPDGEPLLLAGVWDRWAPAAGEAVESFAIATTAPNRMMAQIHDRMPVVLDDARVGRWLDSKVEEPGELLPLLVPCGDDRLRAVAVSSRVNLLKNDDPLCIEPATGGLFDG